MSYSFPSFADTGTNICGHDEHVLDAEGRKLIRGGYAVDCDGDEHRLTGQLNRHTDGKLTGTFEGKAERFRIRWQDGPCNREAGEKPNGAFVEDVLEVCQRRLAAYQDTPFACEANKAAIDLIKNAISVLAERRADRKARGVLGKDEV